MQTTQSESPKTRSETRYVRNGKAGFLKIFGEMRLEISLQVSVVIKWKQGHSETINSMVDWMGLVVTTDPPSKQKKIFFVTFYHYLLNEK